MVDVNARRRLCTIVAAAFIDGKFENAEKGVVYKKGRELGFTPAAIDEIVDLGRKGALAVSMPPTQKAKEDLLDDLIDIACADKKLEPAENHLLMKFAGQIGLSVQDVGERVRRKLGQGRKPEPAVSHEPVLIIDEPRSAMSPPPLIERPKAEVDILHRAPKEFVQPRPYGGMDDADRQRLAAEDIKPLPPGPVQLAGPSLLGTESGSLGYITLELVKQRIMVEGVDSAVKYVQSFCGIAEEREARKIVSDLVRQNPGIKPGQGHANLV